MRCLLISLGVLYKICLAMSRFDSTKLFPFSLLTAIFNEAGKEVFKSKFEKNQLFYFHIDFIVDNVFQLLVFAKTVQ